MKPLCTWPVLVAATLCRAAQADAQSWMLRLNASAQRVQLRAVNPDSVADSLVTTTAASGPVTPDGFATNCAENGYCYYFRPGAVLTGIPASAGVDLSLWGLGVQGLSVHLSARADADLSGGHVWPGTTPPVTLLEGYAEYLRDDITVRAGRMFEQGRLASMGTSGLDGLRATWQFHDNAFQVGGYAGWGLARGTVLPVNSPAVDPLEEYQPSSRQIVVGVLGGLHVPRIDLETEYRRELDPVTDYIVSERAALSAQVQATSKLRLITGADYDIAQAQWGSAEASVAYAGHDVWITIGARHYRPFFDLWTVWGVFSPVPYNAVNGSVAVSPVKRLQLHATGEWFRYAAAGVSVPTVPLEDRGWRWTLDGTYMLASNWTIDVGAHGSVLPGASSNGIDTKLNWRPGPRWRFGAEGGSLESPLELRFQNDGVNYGGGSVEYHTATERWRVGLNIDRYWQAVARPDAASFDFNQWRMSARIAMTLRSSADRWLPPARLAGAAP